ncbi:MAG: PEP-CTERM system histidine kinase PrsK [Pseudomonadota bacterium]|nr:PEP-CTERM system histidine kinase PrsK [Pseudomonadota bacterium]
MPMDHSASIAAISYGLAAIAFASLALTSRGRDGPPGVPGLAVPAAASFLWAAILAIQALLRAGQELAALAELGRNLVWVWFLWRNLRALRAKTERVDRLAFLGRGLGGLAALAFTSHVIALFFPASQLSYWIGAVFPALFAVAGMVLVEQFYRNSSVQERWGIKHLCLALGGIFVFDFYLFSEAMLFAAISQDGWIARGAVNALLVPLLWTSLRRRANTDMKLAISHRMAFHSAALMGAGLYLMLMAAAGYYIRFAGGEWGAILQTVFLFGAALVLLLAVFSSTVRAKLRVYLAKHFFRYRYDYREEWLRFTSMLTEGEPDAQVYERSLQAMARLVDSPAAGLWLKQEGGVYRRAAHWNFAELEGQLEADHAFAAFLESRQWVLDLKDCKEQPGLLVETNFPAWLLACDKAWLIIPLLWHERLSGFVVLAKSMSQPGMDWEINDLLKTAARQAAAHLAQAQAAEALTVARQFESFNRAAAFVVHDIKNLVAQLSLLLANAEKHKHKPEFQEDMLATIESSVARMNRMLLKLSDEPGISDKSTLDLGAMLHEVMQSKSAYSLKPKLHIEAEGMRVKAEREKLVRVVGHLIQNAIEATPYTGNVSVTLARADDWAVLKVEDTGSGMDAAFIRERLFRPFASTKGTGMGIGAYECKEYVQELNGNIQVASHPGRGTLFTVRLPLITEPTS